jgi:hypothetical protein
MVKAFWVLCLYRRPELVGFALGGPASAAFVAAAAHVVQVPAVSALADLAHVASVVAAVADLNEALVGFVLEPVHDAFVVVAAVAVAVALVLRRVRLAVVVVAQVAPHVQPGLRLLHDRFDVARSAAVFGPARFDVVRVAQ